MNRIVRHMQAWTWRHMSFACLLVAGTLLPAGTLVPAGKLLSGALPAAHERPSTISESSAESVAFESAPFDGFSRAVRDLNVRVLSERVSERKPVSDTSLHVDDVRSTSDHPSDRTAARASHPDGAAPPRLLFYLHSALLI